MALSILGGPVSAPAQERPASNANDAAAASDALFRGARSITEAYGPSGEFLGYDVAPNSNIPDLNNRIPNTNIVLRIPAAGFGSRRPLSPREIQENRNAVQANSVQPHTVTLPNNVQGRGETPASVACAAAMVPKDPANPGCLDTLATQIPAGGKATIFLVETGNNLGVDLAGNKGPGVADIVSDMQVFSNWFGLSPVTSANFSVVNVPGEGTPPDNSYANLGTGNRSEADMDAEWARAANPQANIVVIQLNPNNSQEPFVAMDYAVKLAQQAFAAGQGPNVISFSWGLGAGAFLAAWQTAADAHLPAVSGVAVVASNGDTPANPAWPCYSIKAICAGGTNFDRDLATQAFLPTKQSVWHVNSNEGTAGGYNLAAATPDFQVAAAKNTDLLPYRATPDLSTIATNAWFVMGGIWGLGGGTSLSAPVLAGWISAANANVRSGLSARGLESAIDRQFSAAQQFSTQTVLQRMYSTYASATAYQNAFLAVDAGNCGVEPVGATMVTLNAGPASPCTGLGQPFGLNGLSVVPARKGIFPIPRPRPLP